MRESLIKVSRSGSCKPLATRCAFSSPFSFLVSIAFCPKLLTTSKTSCFVQVATLLCYHLTEESPNTFSTFSIWVVKLLETIGKILQNGIFLLLLIRLPRISSKFSRKCEIPVKQGGVFNTSTRFSAVKNVENGKNKFLTTKIEIKKIIH